jgi:putative transposase
MHIYTHIEYAMIHASRFRYLVHRSQGQYISDAFKESMNALMLEHKFIAYHKLEDDPYIESFHGKFKREYIWPRDFQSFQEAETAIAEAFVDYNQNRPHSSLGYLSDDDRTDHLLEPTKSVSKRWGPGHSSVPSSLPSPVSYCSLDK